MIKISRKSANRLIKAGYSIYSNDKIIINKKYAKYKFNFEEILEAFGTLITGIENIIYSVLLLIIALLGFIPRIHIINNDIDNKEQSNVYKIDEEMRKRFNK